MIPKKYRSFFLLTDYELNNELLKMTDAYTDVLFNSQFDKIIFPISRLVCDVERFRDDNKETMANNGMGVIYTTTSDGHPLKVINDEIKDEILRNYYDSHHSELEKRVAEGLRKNGLCLIIDAHSFPSHPLPYESNQSLDRPEFCIGSDSYHTPKSLVRMILEFLGEKGYKVDVNNPFSGSIVPIKYYRKSMDVISVMIEINRKLYMDENTGEKNNGFINTQDTINEILSIIRKWEKDYC
jgi:N-formylglutamate amidohydrolase